MSAPNATRLAAMIALSPTLFIAGCASAEKSAAGPLADRLGRSRETVERSRRRLRGLGLLGYEQRPGRG